MAGANLGRGSGPQATLRRASHVVALGVRAQPRLFALAVAGSAVYGVMTAAMAQAVGWVTEHHVRPAIAEQALSGRRALIIAGMIVAVVAFTTIGVLLRRIAGGFTMFNVAADYRRRVTRQYLHLPLAWHHRHPSGQLLSNANADVEAAWNIFMPLPMALGVIVMLLAGAGQMLLVDPVLAAVGLTIFPLLFAANAVFQRRMSARVTRAQQLRAEVAEVAHESFDGALLVKVMGREEHETRRFAEVSDRLRCAAIAVGRTRGTFDPVIEAIPTFGTFAVLAVGVGRIRSGAITTTELVQLAYLISVLAFPVRALGWVLGEMPRTLVGWDRVNAVLSARGAMGYGAEALAGGAGLVSDPGATGARERLGETGANAAGRGRGIRLELDGVGYDYALAHRDAGGPDHGLTLGTTWGAEAQTYPPVVESADRKGAAAVHDVSLEITPGRTVAIVGPTGSGKSTLAALVVRLIDPSSGVVRVDGTDVRDLARGELSAAVALVPQQTFVFDDTIRGNITLGLPVPDALVWEALRIAQADGFVAALPHGLDTAVAERGTTLSGGQRQRLALARALVRRPRLLVLDDATSAVDPTIEQAILAELGAGRDASTVLVIAYRLATIGLADEVVYLEGGRLRDRGPHEHLMGRCAGYRDLVTAYARQAAEQAKGNAAGTSP